MAAVAPMDLVVKSDASSIPLRCTICPKRPNFSDLSHLLTHISSKSHLAHRFKVELKARGDRDALEEIRQYDDWCERYGINALLAERMAAKEQKKTNKRGRQSHATVSRPMYASRLAFRGLSLRSRATGATWAQAVATRSSLNLKNTRPLCQQPARGL